ncbi:MAG: response regulator [Anaerolineae bacterium]|nr:response regulator [Anaerolineae bacterium]
MQGCEWRVLIVEDEVDSLELMQMLLGHQGICSRGVQNAEDALLMIEELKPTLILIDLALPTMDGWELLRKMQQNSLSRDVPKVATTAYHTPLLATRAIAAGFAAFLPKPIDAVNFVHDLGEVVGKHYAADVSAAN